MKVMLRYKNVDGKSKVARFHNAKDAVTIRYTDGSEYIYTNQSADPANIAKMKELALSGKGLDSFIETVKDRYCRKVR
jgi:hypothetical protein